jgi:hypothetical protein
MCNLGRHRGRPPNRAINPEISHELSRRLADTEREHKIRILYCCESGSNILRDDQIKHPGRDAEKLADDQSELDSDIDFNHAD